MDAILLAGGGKCAADDALCPDQYRALLDIVGKPMISYVAEALHASGRIDKIFVVGDKSVYEPVFADYDYIETVPEGKGIVENVVAGASHCAKGHFLLATIDIPLITGKTVNDFIDICLATPENTFFYPVVEQSINEAAYPETKRTYFRMKEGNFTGGNLMVLHTSLLESHSEKFETLLTHRKSAVKMAFDIGLLTLLKMALGKLSLQEAEKRCCKALDIKGKVVISSAAELCLDVDKPSDYKEALKNIVVI